MSLLNSGSTPGVDVRYLAAEPASYYRLSQWDFMLVGLPGQEEQHDAVIWREVSSERHPMVAVYSCTPMHGDTDLNAKWAACWEHAVSESQA